MIERQGKLVAAREMVSLVRVASVEGWPRMIVAVEEALRLGTCDGGAVLYVYREPDAAKREQHQMALAEELEFQHPKMTTHTPDGQRTGVTLQSY
jgi:hypothetical protein